MIHLVLNQSITRGMYLIKGDNAIDSFKAAYSLKIGRTVTRKNHDSNLRNSARFILKAGLK